MLIDLINGVNIYISYSNSHISTNFSQIKNYDAINWKVLNNPSQDEFLKIHLLDGYKINNLSIDMKTMLFDTLKIETSRDNVNWSILEEEIPPSAIFNFTFDPILLSYIRITFINAEEVYINMINIEYDKVVKIDDYKNVFEAYKVDEFAKSLPDKLFENSDIKELFKEWLTI